MRNEHSFVSLSLRKAILSSGSIYALARICLESMIALSQFGMQLGGRLAELKVTLGGITMRKTLGNRRPSGRRYFGFQRITHQPRKRWRIVLLRRKYKPDGSK